ncbi:MAG: hypothetical protein KGH98_05040 [Candidatus Micrarchaeota archaeon]|nr:hypothetical protein [Candidatus Micrarchaeota archaeon]
MISVGGLGVSLDRRESGSDIDFISHAHSDHVSAAKGSSSILASDETVSLLMAAHGIGNVKRADSSFSLLDAGHMLGSKQLCIEDESLGGRIIYTGDFQLQGSRAAKRIEIKEADAVILDSTYPDPSLRFGDRLEVEGDLQAWASKFSERGIVLFGSYTMGKAQELIMLLNEIGITPVCGKRIGAINNAYRANGIDLDCLSQNDGYEYEELLRDNFVGIVENSRLSALARALAIVHDRPVFTAVATGFAKRFRFDTDAQFPLSDHADFAQSVEYIESTGAKNVYTYGKGAEEFAANLSRLGFDARPFSEMAAGMSSIR